MPSRLPRHLPVAPVTLVIAFGLSLCIAQSIREDPFALDRGDVPSWEVDEDFENDLFTFARIRYRSTEGSARFGRRGEGWETDYPSSDLNFSFRLQQLTSLLVKPDPKVLDLTEEALFDHPFIYIVEPTSLEFDEEEASALRRYLMNGGFLLVDDLWGDRQWNHIHAEMSKVFPDREPVELPIEHEIFHFVYDLDEKPQVPSIRAAQAGRSQGITWQGGDDARTPHFRAYFDDSDRMVALICHNTDIGDGWEREGEDEWYFREFSEKKSYPMGINILVYALTH